MTEYVDNIIYNGMMVHFDMAEEKVLWIDIVNASQYSRWYYRNGLDGKSVIDFLQSDLDFNDAVVGYIMADDIKYYQ